MPLATWLWVAPWAWGWYQKVPAGCGCGGRPASSRSRRCTLPRRNS